MNNTMKVMAMALFALATAGVRAADTTPAAAENLASFENWNIDRWTEGTVQAIDAKNEKFTIHGHQRAWASEYAKMMKDIHDKTTKLDPAARAAKADEIRKSYADSLAKIRNENEKDADFTFYVPKENNGRLTMFDMQGAKGNLTFAQRGLSDLKIGEPATIGYAAGTLYDYAHDFMHGSASDAQLENLMNSQMPDFAPHTAH